MSHIVTKDIKKARRWVFSTRWVTKAKKNAHRKYRRSIKQKLIKGEWEDHFNRSYMFTGWEII